MTGIYFTYDKLLEKYINSKKPLNTVKKGAKPVEVEKSHINRQTASLVTLAISQFVFVTSVVQHQKMYWGMQTDFLCDFLWEGQDKVKRAIMMMKQMEAVSYQI